MVALPKIDILDVGMGGKMLSMFSMVLCWKMITYILEKLLGNTLLLRKNAGRTFVTTLDALYVKTRSSCSAKKTLLKYFAKFK